jgi:hypothetical protein
MKNGVTIETQNLLGFRRKTWAALILSGIAGLNFILAMHLLPVRTTAEITFTVLYLIATTSGLVAAAISEARRKPDAAPQQMKLTVEKHGNDGE